MTNSSPNAAPPAVPRSFRYLISSWAISLSGDGLRVVALPLLAATIDRSPAAVAAVFTFTALPWLLIAIPAGALADRMNSARAVAYAHVVRAGVTGGLVAVLLSEAATIPLLCAFGFAITAAETFADSAAQSLLVHSVPGPSLERANARFVTVETIALDLVGPLAGGALFTLATWAPFAVSAALFAVAAVAVAPMIRLPDVVAAAEARPIKEPLRVSVGLRELWRNSTLRVLVVTVAVMALANAAVDGQLVLFATGPLGLSDALYPTLLAAYSVGTLIAAASVSRVSQWWRGGQAMMVALAGIGVSMLLMGVFPHPVVAWLGYGLMGIAGGTWNVLSATRRQRSTRRGMIARVSSAFRVIAWGMNPLGGILGGAIGEFRDVPTVFIVSGIAVIAWGILVAKKFLAAENEPPEAGLAD